MKVFILLLYFLSNTFPQFNWKKLNEPAGGRTGAIFAKGDTLLCGANSTIYTSTDRGNNWRQSKIDIKYRFSSFAFHSTGFFGACSQGIYKSTDLINWTNILSGDYGPILNDIYGNLYTRKYYNILKSSDGGNVWHLLHRDPEGSVYAIGITKNYFFYTRDSIVFKQKIGAVNDTGWTSVSLHFSPIDYLITDNTGERLIALPLNGPVSAYSKDEGITWSHRDMSTYFGYVHTEWASWNGSSILLKLSQGSDEKLMRSIDNGNTWALSTRGLPPKIYLSRMASSGKDFFITTGGAGIFKSSDYGRSWIPVSNGLKELGMSSIIKANDGSWFCSTYGKGILTSKDSGDTWEEFNNGLGSRITWGLTKTRYDYFFVTLDDGIYRFKYKEENTWEKVHVDRSTVFVDRNDRLFFIHAHLNRSTDLGNTWVQVSPVPYQAHGFTISNRGTMLLSADKMIYRSVNDGDYWYSVFNSQSFLIDMYTDRKGNIFAGSYNGIFKSTDDGLTWRGITSGLSNKLIKKVFSDVHGNYFCSSQWTNEIYPEFYYSSDEGESWSIVTQRLLHSEVYDLLFGNNSIFLFTERGAFVSNPPVPFPVIIHYKHLTLQQNYPNPFNASTLIKYSLQGEGTATIKIYDVLGNELTTILNEYKGPGEYETNFEASELPSGIYFYEIRQNDQAFVKKMILMK